MTEYNLNNDNVSIYGIEEMKTLTILDIEETKFPLASSTVFSNVETLYIRNVDFNINTKIQFMGKTFPKLQTLKIFQLFIEPELVMDLKSLQELYIYKCESLTSLKLRNCSNLHTLTVNVNKNLTHIDDENSKLSLESISIDHCRSLQNLNMEHVFAVKLLKITECASFQGFGYLENYTSLEKCMIDQTNLPEFQLTAPGLQILALSECDSLAVLELDRFHNLEQLTAIRCEQLKRVRIANLKLQSVQLGYNPKLALVDVDRNVDFQQLTCFMVQNSPNVYFGPDFDINTLAHLDKFICTNSGLETFEFAHLLIFNSERNTNLINQGLLYFTKAHAKIIKVEYHEKTVQVFNYIKEILLTKETLIEAKTQYMSTLYRILVQSPDLVVKLNIIGLFPLNDYIILCQETHNDKFEQTLAKLKDQNLLLTLSDMLQPVELSLEQLYQKSAVLLSSKVLHVFQSHYQDPCPICLEPYTGSKTRLFYSSCGHGLCSHCNDCYTKNTCYFCNRPFGEIVSSNVLDIFDKQILTKLNHDYGKWDQIYNQVERITHIVEECSV